MLRRERAFTAARGSEGGARSRRAL